MYSTCLFCSVNLGSNRAIEHFPIGRRLAFDGAKGRLWVICRRCERWNLTPLEERWEAIEECERLFRATALRASTDNIGLARLTEGLELVRVGAPQRPELAAWRYGDQFGRRRVRHTAYAAASGVAVVGLFIAGPALGIPGVLALAGMLVERGFSRNFQKRMETTLTLEGLSTPLLVRGPEVRQVAVIPVKHESGWALSVPIAVSNPFSAQLFPKTISGPDDQVRVEWNVDGSGSVLLTGNAALVAAGRLLPKINHAGAEKEVVQRAADYIERVTDPQQLFVSALQRGVYKRSAPVRITRLLPHVRLALEMITHEDVEQRALDGEMSLLETAWREAEEIAQISDDLLVPPSVDAWLRQARTGADRSAEKD